MTVALVERGKRKMKESNMNNKLSFLILTVVLMFWASGAQAIPKLQLDILGGTSLLSHS